jgi:hypothetical protein
MSEMDKEVGTKGVEDALAAVDAAKRETLRKLILGAAFVVPIVASFTVDGLTSKAYAEGGVAYSGQTSPPG